MVAWTAVLLALAQSVPADRLPAFAFVPLAQMATTQRTYVCTDGPVVYVRQMADKDWHVTLDDSRAPKLVVEIMAAIPLAVPAKGMTIRVCGMAHRDEWHNWMEIHPVLSWQEVAVVRPSVSRER